jgi:SAM-dependent methyltransferase
VVIFALDIFLPLGVYVSPKGRVQEAERNGHHRHAVDPSNRAAFQAWNGEEGDYWAENDDLYDAGLARYDPAFFAAAGVAPTDRVLDIGSGNGSTTCEAARRAPQGTALGVDLSARMIERARCRATAAGLTNAQFLQADAQIYPFPQGSFDQALSRTGVMFFGDPATAFSNIGRALRRSGRLTLLVWQDDDHNPWIADFIKAITDRPPPPTVSSDDPNRISFERPTRSRCCSHIQDSSTSLSIRLPSR